MKLDFTKPWWKRKLSLKRLVFIFVMASWVQNVVRQLPAFSGGVVQIGPFKSYFGPGFVAGLVTLFYLAWLGANVE